jgi:hypothetical protein
MYVACTLSGCAGTESGIDPLPCVIGFSDKNIVLRDDTTISLSSAVNQVVRDDAGNFYASASLGGQVLKWGPDGTLLAAIGRPGDGPGELGRGAVSVFTVADSLYVRDSHFHWVVYGPDRSVVRYAPLGPIVGYANYNTHFVGGDRIISTSQKSEVPENSIVIQSRNGDLIRQFAPTPGPAGRWQPHPRASAYVGDGTMWVAPVAGPRDGYRIEIWDTAGQLRDSIVRVVPWFRAQPDFKADYGASEKGRPFPFPNISALFADTAGMVWVLTTVPKGPESEAAVRSAGVLEYFDVLAQVMETNVDVFDKESHRLLASMRISRSPAVMGDPVFDGRLFKRVVEDSSGLSQVSIGELTLSDTNGGTCHVPGRPILGSLYSRRSAS